VSAIQRLAPAAVLRRLWRHLDRLQPRGGSSHHDPVPRTDVTYKISRGAAVRIKALRSRMVRIFRIRVFRSRIGVAGRWEARWTL